MKPMLKISMLAATVALATGCQQEADAQDTSTVEAAAPAAVQFQSEDDKSAYAIGVSFATYLKASIEKPQEIGINLSDEMVLKGIEDTFKGAESLNPDEIRLALESLDQRVSETLAIQAAEKGAATIEAGDNFRAEYAMQEGVTVTDSGLMYKVIEQGEGVQPAADDVVVVHYVGKLIDGTEFDSSVARGEPAEFPLNRVIPGWTEGVQLMSVGSKYELVIPPQLAYGDQDTPAIPGNSTLIFEVELLDIPAAN